MNEYMIYQVWKAMEEDDFVSARQILETLPCLAGVSLQKVQKDMAILWKKKKNGQPPQPPRPLLFHETPLLATKNWTQKQMELKYDVPELKEVVDLVSEAMKGAAVDRREIGWRLINDIPHWLVEKMDKQNNAE